MKKIFPRIAVICFALGVFTPVFADEVDDSGTYKMDAFKVSFAEPWYEKYHFPHLYAFSAGALFSSDAGESEYFPVVNPDTDSFYNYSKTNQTQFNGQFAVFVGDRWQIGFPWQIDAGLSYTQTGDLSTKGTLTQGADVLSEDIYSYKFKIQSRQVEVKGKIAYAYPGVVIPYITLGLGMAINTAKDFSTTAPAFQAITRSYPSNTSSSFTWTVGLGTEYALNANTRLGIGYEFSNNGSVAFGSSNITGIPASGTISQTHFYTHSVMAHVSYFIDNNYWWTQKKLTDWD
jgi:opacity protein-like surface antigen